MCSPSGNSNALLLAIYVCDHGNAVRHLRSVDVVLLVLQAIGVSVSPTCVDNNLEF